MLEDENNISGKEELRAVIADLPEDKYAELRALAVIGCRSFNISEQAVIV